MPLVRTFQELDGVKVFDAGLEPPLSTYDAHHLDVLAAAEKEHFWFQRRRDKVIQLFETHVNKRAKILEIGAGTGFIAEALRDRGFDMEASDIHRNGLLHAKKRGLKKLYQFDLFSPPFEEEYDVICLFDVLEHLSDEGRALECIKKMLKPKGLVIMTVPAHAWLWSQFDAISGHHRRYTKATLEETFRRCKLKPVEMRYFFFSILPLLLLRTCVKKGPAKLDLRIHPFINRILNAVTKAELKLDPYLPNAAGGSLYAIGQTD